MRVERLILNNFRNYDHLDIEFHPDINIFVGGNAQGKTNILEAVFFASMGRSHRTSSESDLIRWDCKDCSFDLFFMRAGMNNRLNFRLKKEGTKEIGVNEQRVRPRELIGELNAVLFSPEDLGLIKGPPSNRRRFLDAEISQANPVYYRNLIHYNRILLQRNQQLKKIRDERGSRALLDPWDEQLARYGAAIVTKRVQSVQKLAKISARMHDSMTSGKEMLDLCYEQCHLDTCACSSPGQAAEIFLDQIKMMREEDIIRGSTGCGPHRDDLSITVNGVDLRVFGSQGQQRTGVLSLKFSELEFIREETGEYPVLLLDDVMSELDERRRVQLLGFIQNRIQTFVTATDERYFGEIFRDKIFHVDAGQVKRP